MTPSISRRHPTITGEQRDAIYLHIIDRLSEINGIALALDQGDLATADRLAREYADELRLICDGLGWGSGHDSTAIELGLPTEVLVRIFTRLRDSTKEERKPESDEVRRTQSLDTRRRLLDEACNSVLRDLEDGRMEMTPVTATLPLR